MRTEVPLTIVYKNKLVIDCCGCDFEETEFTPLGLHDRLKTIKTLLSYRPEKCTHKCKALNIELTNDQMNLFDMAKEECPCHFEKWQQTNSELGDFIDVPTFQFKLKNGTLETTELNVDDPTTKGEKE